MPKPKLVRITEVMLSTRRYVLVIMLNTKEMRRQRRDETSERRSNSKEGTEAMVEHLEKKDDGSRHGEKKYSKMDK